MHEDAARTLVRDEWLDIGKGMILCTSLKKARIWRGMERSARDFDGGWAEELSYGLGQDTLREGSVWGWWKSRDTARCMSFGTGWVDGRSYLRRIGLFCDQRTSFLVNIFARIWVSLILWLSRWLSGRVEGFEQDAPFRKL